MKNMVKYCLHVIGVLAVISLMSCGGGGGDDDDSSPSLSANGIWSGSITIDGEGTRNITALLHNGTVKAYSPSHDLMLAGDYSVRDDDITLNLDIYDGSQSGSISNLHNDFGQSINETMTASGTLTEQASISVTFSSTNGLTGTIYVTFDEIYNRDSSLSLIAGNYVTNPGAFRFTIDDDGSFYGEDDFNTNHNYPDPCVFSGVISILNSDYNLYDTDATVDSCDPPIDSIDGTYSGFTYLDKNSTLHMMLSNAKTFLYIKEFY